MMITRTTIQMSKNKWITIEEPTGIFVMINTKKEEVHICSDCLIPDPVNNGYVANDKDCEHGAKERLKYERTNN